MIPPILFLLLFLIPNVLGWVESSLIELFGMGIITIFLYAAGWAAEKRAIVVKKNIWSYKLILLFFICFIFFFISFGDSAIFLALRDGYSEEARESSLKLASPLLQVLVNVVRDALLPFVLIVICKKRKILLSFVVVLYLYFVAFNLAKSFIIINTIALVVACNPKFSVLLIVKLVAVFLVASFVMGVAIGAFVDPVGYYEFVFDFLIRRILTLTPELGAGVRDMVALHGFYWFNSNNLPFEMELYRFIGHSDLESGWANVFIIADAYGRGGVLGILLAVIALIFYMSWFIYLAKFLGSIYSLYLINLFSVYVFMQGIYSFGLIASFFVGPLFLIFFGGFIKIQKRNNQSNNSGYLCCYQ
jgi:hypothetical protein